MRGDVYALAPPIVTEEKTLDDMVVSSRMPLELSSAKRGSGHRMEVADCQDYRGTCDGRIFLAMPDGRSRFKVYFLSVIGRQQPIFSSGDV
ncbi:MAG: hypothetical protein CM1200mP41_11850 [Gammaproteobacteria bacterium]|nr:MAG: hypothetical protein CM1200mP41_11850 [Gammaproteobacteria bacterium]